MTSRGWLVRGRWAVAAAAFLATAIHAHTPGTTVPIVLPADVPESIRMVGELPPMPNVVDLKFKDIFKRPVGPRGLEPTPAFGKLDGRRVRMVGYMVALTPPTADAFMFSPLPVSVAAHDEGLADDIPPATIYVKLPRFAPTPGMSTFGIPQVQGLLKITGTLEVGAYTDVITGRIFPATLSLDPEPRRAFLQLARDVMTRQPTPPSVPSPAILAGADRPDPTSASPAR